MLTPHTTQARAEHKRDFQRLTQTRTEPSALPDTMMVALSGLLMMASMVMQVEHECERRYPVLLATLRACAPSRVSICAGTEQQQRQSFATAMARTLGLLAMCGLGQRRW